MFKKNCFSKHNLLKRSMEMSNDVSSLSKVRNDIIKDYYAQKLLLLERIVIAKEEKVIIMRAAAFKEV